MRGTAIYESPPGPQRKLTSQTEAIARIPFRKGTPLRWKLAVINPKVRWGLVAGWGDCSHNLRSPIRERRLRSLVRLIAVCAPAGSPKNRPTLPNLDRSIKSPSWCAYNTLTNRFTLQAHNTPQ